jgi:translocation and assembly module TamB
MTDAPSFSPNEGPTGPTRRRGRKRVIAAAGAVLALGGAGAAIGPGAPWIISHVSNGAKIARFGRLHLEGVSGSWLGDLRVRSAWLEDAHGVWAQGSDIAVRWRPFDLILNAKTHIDIAHAGAIRLLRQPELSPAEPETKVKYHAIIDALSIDTLTVEEPVVGARGQFSATAGVDVSNTTLERFDLEVHRLDAASDHALAHFRLGENFALHADIGSDKGGVIARALGFPDQALSLTADGGGQGQTGQAHFDGAIGANHLAAGALDWSAARWTLHTNARLDLLSATHELARRLGDHLTIEASGAPHAAFSAHAETPNVIADLAGRLNDQWALDGPTHVIATTPRISSIAPEAPFEFGQARFEGALEHDERHTALNGQLDAQDLSVLGRNVHMAGPAQARLDDNAFSLSADLKAAADAPALFKHAELSTELGFDRRRGRFSLARARLQGDAIAIDAQGWSTGGDGEFSGNWQIRDLGALATGLRGSAQGRWRAFATRTGPQPGVWGAAFDGAGDHISGQPDIAPQLLGPESRLDGLVRFTRTGLEVDHVRVDGAQLRAAARGRIVHGQSDLALEASARGPLKIGNAEIAGAADATGQLTGPFVRPTLHAHAQLASFSAAGVDINQPDIVFTLAPAGNSYRGQAQMQGRYGDQSVSATSDVAIAAGALSLDNLAARIAALEGHGHASFSAHGADAQLVLGGRLDGLSEGLAGGVQGHAALTPQMVEIDAQIADAHAGELKVRAAHLSASGPYRAIAVHFDMRGALHQAPLTFTGAATIAAQPHGADVAIEGRGALAGAAIATRAPLHLSWSGETMDANLDMALADGGLTAHWRERGRVLQGVATIGETPIAPLASIFGETATGRIGGNVELTNTGAGLAGDAHVTLTDARFAGRQRGALSGAVIAHLDPGRLTAVMDATSSDGLVAHFEADAPVVTSAEPIRIALAPQRRGRASWSVHGPAGVLWAAARLPDQDLEGDLSGEGQITFGAGYLAGDGHINIANGRFEDKVTGVKLQAIDAAVSVTENGVAIQHFTATDGRQGHVVATGGNANPQQGAIALELTNLRFLDRPDAHATASGRLNFAWHGGDATLSGDLNLGEADVSIAQNPQAGIPTIDVVEINRPGGDDDQAAPGERRQALGATKLDIRINAPGRVFTRGRGVEAEWSLNMRVGGTSIAPLIYGEAQTLRGQLSLSGQPFDIDDGHIYFNGVAQDARVNITATRETADLTAHVQLTGTAADPEVSFTSSPALPEDEILPQILFGHSVADLNALEAAQLAASLAALSGQASFNLVDAARAAAGLDRFDVRQDASGGFLVAGGVYLTREIYVEVSRSGLGQAGTRVEWTIRPKLVLITSFLQNGDQRASIRWRRESN